MAAIGADLPPRVRVDGLAPSTRYRYKVVSDGTTATVTFPRERSQPAAEPVEIGIRAGVGRREADTRRHEVRLHAAVEGKT